MRLARFFAFAALVSLVTSALFVVALNINGVYAQSDDLWYPGEGVKQDMFVKYRIQEIDTNGKQPFEMTMYFQGQDEEGDWIVPAFVVDESGKVINGTMKLSENMAALSGGSNVPAEMTDYVAGYGGSLHWVDSFTTKRDPKSLNDANWGRTGSIGGSDLKPSGKETITVPAGTYETTVVVLHKGQADSKIWILNEFPFPIKADFFTDTTAGTPQTQFKFELLETGTGQPEVPASAEQIPKPPLGPKDTERGTYEVSLDWEPAEIRPNAQVSFGIIMAENTGFPLERVNYDFTVKDSGGNVVEEFKNQNAALGTGTHLVTFDSAGSMTVTVVLNSISGVPTGGGTFTESADFNIVVVPEFPYGAAAIAAGVIGMLVLLTRARGSGLRRLFGSRNTI
jgi:hypothetical protein